MEIKKLKIKNEKRGYTIIETMIAVSLFVVIVTIGMGSLLNANSIHQKSQDMRSIIDSLSFAIEDMSRNLRTGYNYQCFETGQTLSPGSLSVPRSCEDGWAVAFEFANGNLSTYGDQWVYYIGDDGKIWKSVDGAANFVELTPDEVVIDPDSFFIVDGAEPPPGDTTQPFVTIRLVGSITYQSVVTPFSLQTSVSQRLIDI